MVIVFLHVFGNAKMFLIDFPFGPPRIPSLRLFLFSKRFFNSVWVGLIADWESTGYSMVANPARGQLHRENEFFPVSVRA